MKQLGKQRVNSLFTHLRKIAQHPLLVRNLYSDDQVQQLVTLAHNRYVTTAFQPIPDQSACTTLTAFCDPRIQCSSGE